MRTERNPNVGPWDEKTGIFAPLFHQPYQVETESLRNVVRHVHDVLPSSHLNVLLLGWPSEIMA